MGTIGIMAHEWQYNVLSQVFDFTKSKVKRIDYSRDAFVSAASRCDKVFLLVSWPHHVEFSAIAKELQLESACVSLYDAYQFYTQLDGYCPKKIQGFDLIRFLVRNDMMPREYYAYGLTLATAVALRMNVQKLTAIEFGVFHGTGLLAMAEICRLIEEHVGVRFKVIGFDTGHGLPLVADWRDHAELWSEGDMVMPDVDALRSSLPDNCELVIGDIKDTLPESYSKIFDDSVLAFVSIDVDTYGSTRDALNIFRQTATGYLPVVPVWVDDSYINIFQTNFAGEALAIDEFNRQSLRKIDKKIVRTNQMQKPWHHCFYFAHIFDHPLRNTRNQYNFYLNPTDY